MSLKTQAKVLRVLQEQRIEPVGGAGSVEVDVRVVAATNKDLEEEISERPLPRGPLLPPERRPVPRAAAARAARGRPAPRRATSWRCSRPSTAGGRARSRPRRSPLLAELPWPGNVRELRNIVERLVIMTPGDRIELRHLPGVAARGLPAAPRERRGRGARGRGETAALAAAREDFERRYIRAQVPASAAAT